MPRILITVQHIGLGGMEKMVAELALGLTARGYDLCVVVVEVSDHHADRLRDAGIDVHTDLASHSLDPLAIYRLRKICRSGRYDFAIAAHGSLFSPFVTLWVCNTLGIPCVRWMHTSADGPKSIARRLGHRFMTKAGNKVVALTQTHARFLSEQWGIPASQITVIWNGQPLPPRRTPESCDAVRQELGLESNCFVIGMVAGFRPVKRHEVAIQAMAKVIDHVNHAHLLLVGDGSMRQEAEELVSRLGLSAHVTFSGARTDAQRLYAAMDVHILCSYPAETFPLVVTEAMGAGVPPIATRVGGIPELITDGVTGLLVAPESPKSLAEAIVDLSGDESKRQRLGEAAYHFAVSHFSRDAMVDRFVELIESSCKTAPSSDV